MSGVFFFYAADREILDLSESKERLTYILDCLDLEIKLLVLLIPPDDYVVFPPSHFLESPICRKLIFRNLAFLHDGYIRLWMREPTLSEYREKKREQYLRVSHIEKYKLAYYSSTDYGIMKLPFAAAGKRFLTGKASLDIWEEEIQKAGLRIGYPASRLQDLMRRVRGGEEEPFLWESVQPIIHSMDFTTEHERLLGIRASITTSYLEAHKLHNLRLPTGSMVVRDVILPQEPEYNAYNLLKFRRVLQLVGVFTYIADFSAEKILRLKFKIPHIMKEVKSLLHEGLTSERVTHNLEQAGLGKELRKVVKQISSGGILRPSGTEGLGQVEETPKIKLVYKGHTEREWIRVAVVQLSYSLAYNPSPFSYALNRNEKGEVKRKVFSALEIAEREKVNIVCFPELVFDEEWVKEVRGEYGNMIIVCGSYYDRNSYNTCPIIMEGDIYCYKKVKASPFEKIEATGHGMKSGDTIYVFQTKYGKLSVLLCIDYTDQIYRVYKHKPDIVINPCCDPNILRFQERASIDARDYESFIIQANEAEHGGTCIIGKEHKIILERLKKDGFKPDDNITYKLCQANGEMMIIADINIRMKAPPIELPVNYEGRIRISPNTCFKCKDGIWLQGIT